MASVQQALMIGCGRNRFRFTYAISSSTSVPFDLKAAAIAAGWNQTTPIDATVTVDSGVTLGSNSAATPAFATGSGYPDKSSLTLTNNGTILGATGAAGVDGLGGDGGSGGDARSSGGDGKPGGSGGRGNTGGTALIASVPLVVNNYGTIAGGIGGAGGRGGGGGGGGDSGDRDYAGQSGGDGQGRDQTRTRNGGDWGMAGKDGRGYHEPGSNGLDLSGGTGGAAGAAGATGATGAYVVGNSNVTWSVVGTRIGTAS